MKKLSLKLFLAIYIVSLFNSSQLNAMQKDTSAPAPTPVVFSNLGMRAAFLPQDDIKSILFSFLGRARKQILVAMYWITNDSIIDRLIAIKKGNIDIQIIIDESSKNIENTVNKFLQANITPLVFPSGVTGSYMHYKFVVVDGSAILTGSADFTKKNFESKAGYFNNYENIVILNLPSIAQEYTLAFKNLEQIIFDHYIDMISKTDPDKFPQWAKILFPKHYDQLKKIAQDHLSEFNQDELARIKSYFDLRAPISPHKSQITSIRNG